MLYQKKAHLLRGMTSLNLKQDAEDIQNTSEWYMGQLRKYAEFVRVVLSGKGGGSSPIPPPLPPSPAHPRLGLCPKPRVTVVMPTTIEILKAKIRMKKSTI